MNAYKRKLLKDNMKIWTLLFVFFIVSYTVHGHYDTTKTITLGVENAYLFSENALYSEIIFKNHGIECGIAKVYGDHLTAKVESNALSFGFNIGYTYRLNKKSNYSYLYSGYKYRYVHFDSVVTTIEQLGKYSYDYRTVSHNLGLIYGKKWFLFKSNLHFDLKFGAYFRQYWLNNSNYRDVTDASIVWENGDRDGTEFSVIPTLEFALAYRFSITH